MKITRMQRARRPVGGGRVDAQCLRKRQQHRQHHVRAAAATSAAGSAASSAASGASAAVSAAAGEAPTFEGAGLQLRDRQPALLRVDRAGQGDGAVDR